MVKKWLCLIGLVGSIVSIGSAQEATPVASSVNHVMNPITSIELVNTEDVSELVIKGDLPDGCDIPTTINTENTGDTWFIDLYREVPADTMCPAMLKSYEERVNIGDLFDVTALGQQILVINGTLYSVEAFDPADEPVLNGLWARGPLPYDHIAVTHETDGTLSVTLSGTLTDGCAIPVYRATADGQGITNVDAYTAISLNAMCAQVLTPFETAVSTPAFDALFINGVAVPFDPALSKETQEFEEQALSISTATAEWVEGILPNIKITVTGVTDGCDFPIQLVPQKPVDNTYAIKVVRVLPAGTACTKIAREFTQDLMLAPNPQLVGQSPVVIYIGDQMITLE